MYCTVCANSCHRRSVSAAQSLTRWPDASSSRLAGDDAADAETAIFKIARAIEARDPSTVGHVERVSRYAAELGTAIGLSHSQVAGLRRAGVVHDIGKVVVPDAILLKPGALTSEERRSMQRHAEAGFRLLRRVNRFAESLLAVRHHHERLDGSGYPLGLRGSQVPIVAQVIAVVDVYDALTTDRVYRAALSPETAFDILRNEAVRGLHDPQLVDTFVRLVMPAPHVEGYRAQAGPARPVLAEVA